MKSFKFQIPSLNFNIDIFQRAMCIYLCAYLWVYTCKHLSRVKKLFIYLKKYFQITCWWRDCAGGTATRAKTPYLLELWHSSREAAWMQISTQIYISMTMDVLLLGNVIWSGSSGKIFLRKWFWNDLLKTCYKKFCIYLF